MSSEIVRTADPAAERTAGLMQRIFPSPRRFAVRLGIQATLPAEASGFEVRNVENLREHYALTLRNWVRRLESHHPEAAQLAGEDVYRTWRLYMSFCVTLFETAQIGVNQSLLARPLNGKANLPMSRADLYSPA